MTRQLCLLSILLLGTGAGAQTLPVMTIHHPEPQAGDNFGQVLAVVGDYLCVATTHRNVNGQFYSGAVYIHNRHSGAFLARIDPPSVITNQQFGFAMVPLGEDRVVISSYTPMNVRIHQVPGGGFVRSLVDPTPGLGFGFSMATEGEVVAVCDYYEDVPDTSGGMVFLYNGTTGALTGTIGHPNPSLQNWGFGNSLRLYDGVLYAGSIYSRPLKTQGAGEGYAVRLSDGVRLGHWSDPTEGQNLLGADIEVVGTRTAIAPGYDDGLPYGFLYIYEGFEGDPSVTIRSPGLASENRVNDQFGTALAEFQGDLLIGTPRGPHDAEVRRGVVYRHDPVSGELLGTLLPPVADDGQRGLGSSIQVSGDYIYIGSPGGSFSTAPPGAVYVYHLPQEPELEGWIVR